jgi:hypothetical protein
MPENTESGRRTSWDDGETEKKRKSCSPQNGVGTKPETKEASAEPGEWTPKMLSGPALRPSPGLAADGARYRGCPPFQAYPPAAQLDFRLSPGLAADGARPYQASLRNPYGYSATLKVDFGAALPDSICEILKRRKGADG